MLPGMMIVTEPGILAYTLASTLEKRTEANAIAHPSLAQIDSHLQTVSAPRLDELTTYEGRELHRILCGPFPAMEKLRSSVVSLITNAVLQGRGGGTLANIAPHNR